MLTKHKFTLFLLMLLVIILTACDSQMKFVAPKIDPPTDLIPGYVPEGFELGFGYQLPGKGMSRQIFDGDVVSFAWRAGIFDLRSPNENDIQGVYYQGKDQVILISKSYYPGGTIDAWLTAYEASQPQPCECECFELRINNLPHPYRLYEIQEEHTIDGTRVVTLKGPLGWITVFVRGEYLLTVESGISLEENLKIVASLLKS